MSRDPSRRTVVYRCTGRPCFRGDRRAFSVRLSRACRIIGVARFCTRIRVPDVFVNKVVDFARRTCSRSRATSKCAASEMRGYDVTLEDVSRLFAPGSSRQRRTASLADLAEGKTNVKSTLAIVNNPRVMRTAFGILM